MAGGTITRIAGGKLTKEIEGDYTIWTDNYTINSGGKISFTSDKDIIFGTPPPPPSAGKYFEKGWWTDKNGKEIKEAKLGDKVQFHLQMRNIYPLNGWENEFVYMKLREFDGDSLFNLFTFGLTNIKQYKSIELTTYYADGSTEYFQGSYIPENMHIVLNITLEPASFSPYFKKEYKDDTEDDIDLELYMNCSYYSERDKKSESSDLPFMESDYLVVKAPPVVEPIIFVEASDTHKLPAIYSAEDGTPWIVNLLYNPDEAMEKASTFGGLREIKKEFTQGQETAENIEMISNFFKENGGGAYTPEEINKFSKRSYDIAIRKLKKGNLIFNDGSNGVTNRYHKYTVADIDSRFSEEITMGVNRGKFATGVTSKGINQLEAQAGRGLAKVFKTVGDVIPALDTLCDLADILTSAANGTRPPLPFTPPFVMWEINRMMADQDEFNIDVWNKELQRALKINMVAVDKVVNIPINTQYGLGYSFIYVSQEGINKILKKEIRYVNDKSDNKIPFCIDSLTEIGEGDRKNGILVQSRDAKDDYNRPTKNHYIHAIFINNIKV